MSDKQIICEGQILTGALFNEPMRVETIRTNGPESWVIGLVGTQSERYRKVTLSDEDIKTLTISEAQFNYEGNGSLLHLGLQAYSLGIAYEFDPYFGLSISRVDPLPHQLEAVYDYLLKVARVRFLLADDAGAGKTIMAGLLIRELKLRGLAERILIVCPANLAFQWQRELKEKFSEQFLVLKGQDIREQFGLNQWLEQNRVITSLDLAKREDILPGLRQVHWDIIIVDEAHRMSWTPPARKTARYALGELLRDTTDHILLLTATPHKGDPANFSLFLQLLDADAYAEFKDTLDYLMGRLKGWGFRVGCIHGSMESGSRDKPGSRLYAEQQFKEGNIQILVATEAAGEGINLQCCNILFNYDIPWNPNRLEQRMGRIHRYGQPKDCLIFNFVATNTIEGSVLQRLLKKLQEIRDALDNDAVFNVVGEVLPSTHIERVLRDYYAGKFGEADLEERLLKNVDVDQFRAICQNALEGLASKKLNLEMLIERKARAQEHRVVPETIARFIRESAGYVPLNLRFIPSLPHTFEPEKTPSVLRRYETAMDWRLPVLANKYLRCSTDRETAEENNLEWVTPGHPLFEAIRRHIRSLAQEPFGKGACFYSLAHDTPARLDFYRARVVDGLGQVIHEKLFAVEINENEEPHLREPGILGNFIPAENVGQLPSVSILPEASEWLYKNTLKPFLEEVKAERLAEVERIKAHVELSLTELLQRVDDEIGRASAEVEQRIQGAEGRLAQADTRHAELLERRERRRQELEQQRSLALQSVERITSVIVLPHPEQKTPEVRRLKPNYETEAIAMRIVMEYEQAQGRQVFDVHEKNLGYDITSLDLGSGELRLIEIKGLGEASGTVLLTPNERRVAEDRRDCYWLYIVTNCNTTPILQEPIKDPAQLKWHEVIKVQHYWLEVNTDMQAGSLRYMEVREKQLPYGGRQIC